MAKYDSKFDINEAFEQFKDKQDNKGRHTELKVTKTGTSLDSRYRGTQVKKSNRVGLDEQLKQKKDNIFLSYDKTNARNGIIQQKL